MKVTFVCCPKPFNKDFAVIQNNALQSWKRLSVTDNIVVVGDDDGVKEYAETNGMIYHPQVDKNEWNTPLVDSVFKIGKSYTKENNLLCYINSDIVLLDSFSKTIESWCRNFGENTKEVLMIGRRWDWNNPKAIDFTNSDWQSIVTQQAKSDGKMHEYSGIDYFVHTKSTYPFIYPFAIGKYFWDWWLVGNCSRRNIMTIDISDSALVIHQNSPWFQNGKAQTNRRQMYQTKEVQRNHSFDKYGKNIRDGSNWTSFLGENDAISFRKKY